MHNGNNMVSTISPIAEVKRAKLEGPTNKLSFQKEMKIATSVFSPASFSLRVFVCLKTNEAKWKICKSWGVWFVPLISFVRWLMLD